MLAAPRLLRFLGAAAAVAVVACAPAFQPQRFPSSEALYRASLQQFEQRRYPNAIAGFERLTIELPARDTLFSRALYYLGRAHQERREFLLAAQAFTRLAEAFPTDTLADDAILEAGRSYARLWRKPSLDPQYGETALSTLRVLVTAYPTSPLVDEANREIARLNEWFARKAFENGMHYYRRRAYESSIIYFKDVVARYPESPTARDALLRLAMAYRAINYREDVAETCEALRQAYPADPQVREICGAAPAVPAPVTPTGRATP